MIFYDMVASLNVLPTGAVLDITASFRNVFGVVFITTVFIILLAVAMQKVESKASNTDEQELRGIKHLDS